MRKSIRLAVVSLFFLFSLIFSGQAADETLTITTYYPSPYGSYNELSTTGNTTLATTNSTYCVGIGTTGPTSKFQIGTGTSLQQWSGSTPYVLIQGVDNEVATPALTVEDENLGTMFKLTTTGDSTVGTAYFGGKVGIGTTAPNARFQNNAALDTTRPTNMCVRVNYDAASGQRTCPAGYLNAIGSYASANVNNNPANAVTPPTSGYIICCQVCVDGGVSGAFTARDGICD